MIPGDRLDLNVGVESIREKDVCGGQRLATRRSDCVEQVSICVSFSTYKDQPHTG